MAVSTSVSGGLYTGTPELSRWVDCMFLGADAAEPYTVPARANWALITNVSAGTVWVRRGATAVVPTTEIADGTCPQPLPASTALQCVVAPGETLSFIRTAGTAATVTIALHSARPS
jgi:hypothetical protein